MKARSNIALLGSALTATFWGMIAGPIIWVLVMPLVGDGSDRVLYGLGLAILLSLAGYAGTLFLFRRWSR